MPNDERRKIILDLCGGTGAWSRPYVEAGYDVRLVTLPDDVRLYVPPCSVYGVLAAPPCTHLAGSGARWWANKGQGALLEALSITDACMRVILTTKPTWWALENPVGRLRRYYGAPTLIFDPCDYGDPYTKKTLLWGEFKIPAKSWVRPVEKSPIHYMSPGPERAKLRSVTPPGFAKAFFEANQ